jgi:ethanolamine utilization protein EutA (predicted chaperonin)
MTIKKAKLRSFNSGNYSATIQISGSGKTYLEDVPVARNLPVAEMSTGRKLAVIFFDEHNVKDAVVIAVYL